ncbi:MAG: hypothetical protein R3A10_10655 [Caldilineaceae bacterium]
MIPVKLLEYLDEQGRNLFREWLEGLLDRKLPPPAFVLDSTVCASATLVTAPRVSAVVAC